jgi:4-hydroxy-tetrahydrodipicolinate synthase
MHSAELAGVVGALLTPFDADGRVERTRLDAQIELLTGHCDVLSVLGAEVAEYSVLAPAERRTTLRHALERIDGRRPVMAGVSSPALAEVAELSELAAEPGATWAQLLLPNRTWGGEPSAAELVAYVESAARASALPLVLYHNPGAGADPALETLVELTAIDGVAGIKDSSRNISRILRLVEEIERAGRARYMTTLQPLLITLLAGGAGAMMPPPATLVGAAIVRAHRAGDLARAAELQRAVAIFPARWSRHGLAPVMKAAMDALGHGSGDAVAPFGQIPEQDRRAIAETVGAWPADVLALADEPVAAPLEP